MGELGFDFENYPRYVCFLIVIVKVTWFMHNGDKGLLNKI